MHVFFIGFSLVLTFTTGFVSGTGVCYDVVREKVVLYCIEKPDLCKEEYKNIKTQEYLINYKRPDLIETK
jgi:hypothetical protein